jgi:hypothetical protein
MTAPNTAKVALMAYAADLQERGYNKRCIQDSILCLSLDVVLMIERQLEAEVAL